MEGRFGDLESRLKAFENKFGDLPIKKSASRSWRMVKQTPKTLVDRKGRRPTNAAGLSLVVND